MTAFYEFNENALAVANALNTVLPTHIQAYFKTAGFNS